MNLGSSERKPAVQNSLDRLLMAEFVNRGKSQISNCQQSHSPPKMPEKSRGRKVPRGGSRMASTSETKKQVAFESGQMDLDEKFEQLKAPLYKGKKLDDPIKSPLVLSLYSTEGNVKTGADDRINGNCYRPF